MEDSVKFEKCKDPVLGRVLYKVVLDEDCEDELGDRDGFGWYGWIVNRNNRNLTSYIVSEDSQGFFTYEEFPTDIAREKWDTLWEKYDKYHEEENRMAL